MESIFGIIPARGGSKRLPGKNLMLLNGVSLLERTINQAKKAFPVSVVTTESPDIIKEAMRCGMRTLLRPDILATDTATSADVVKHVIWTYPHFEWFCLLQVTSPLRSLADINTCMELAERYQKPVVSTYLHIPNGAIYIHKLLDFTGDFTTGAIQYEMPPERSVDIDTMEDFKIAEALCV